MSHLRLRLCVVLGALLALAGSAHAFAASTTVVVSEFRVRGPVGGSDEFVELYNKSASPVAIGGWKLRGSNASGTISTRATVPAGRILGPGCHYLFTNSSTSGGPYSGPVVGDQTYGTGVTDDGGLALTLADDVTIVDQVGMSTGSAYKEGTPLTNLGSTNLDRGYERLPGGALGNGQDTDNNASDFVLVTPSNPENSALCGGGESTNPTVTGAADPSSLLPGAQTTLTATVTPGANPTSTGLGVTGDLTSIGGSATQTFADDGVSPDAVAGDNVFTYLATVTAATSPGSKSLPVTATDAQLRSGSATISLLVEAPPVPVIAIREIQGAAHISPRVNEIVATRGIVTAKIGSSFYIQDASPDLDPATSEGIQVFGATVAAGVSVGELVTVQGRVTEFRASASAPNPNLSVTELTSPQLLSKTSTTDTIVPSLIGNGGGRIRRTRSSPTTRRAATSRRAVRSTRTRTASTSGRASKGCSSR